MKKGEKFFGNVYWIIENIKNRKISMEDFEQEGFLLKKKWHRKECEGCKFYNPECRMGVCCLYPYRKKKITSSDGEKIDTS